eukprot:SAG22_NODE_124_length_18884_cov_34.149367_10_plen_205_part_00
MSWDYSLVGGDKKQLLLEPGYQYTLTAVVSVWPIFLTDKWLELTFIDKFGSKTESTTVVRTKTDYFHRREARVTYAIKFNPDARQFTIAHNYPLITWFGDACALTVIMSVAHLLLKLWHRFRKHPEQRFAKQAEEKQAEVDARQVSARARERACASIRARHPASVGPSLALNSHINVLFPRLTVLLSGHRPKLSQLHVSERNGQ